MLWLRRHPTRSCLTRIALPLVLVLGFAAVATGYYNWRVTGNAFEMPEALNRRTYAIAPLFLGQQLRPAPQYRNAEMQRFYADWEVSRYLENSHVSEDWHGKNGPSWQLCGGFFWALYCRLRCSPYLVLFAIAAMKLLSDHRDRYASAD